MYCSNSCLAVVFLPFARPSPIKNCFGSQSFLPPCQKDRLLNDFVVFLNWPVSLTMFPKNLGPEERIPMPGIIPEEMVARISLVDVSAGREIEYGTNARGSTLSPQRVYFQG